MVTKTYDVNPETLETISGKVSEGTSENANGEQPGPSHRQDDTVVHFHLHHSEEMAKFREEFPVYASDKAKVSFLIGFPLVFFIVAIVVTAIYI